MNEAAVNDDRPLVLSGRTIKIISFTAAAPLMALAVMFLCDPNYWTDAFTYGFLVPFLCILTGVGLKEVSKPL